MAGGKPSTWLPPGGFVEWLHRRVIPGEGNLLARIALGQWYVSGLLLRSALLKTVEMRIPQDQSIGMGHGLVLCEYEFPPLRSKKVTRDHATSSVTPKFRKLEIFENIDESEPFGVPT